jgi:hypothetical protein
MRLIVGRYLFIGIEIFYGNFKSRCKGELIPCSLFYTGNCKKSMIHSSQSCDNELKELITYPKDLEDLQNLL